MRRGEGFFLINPIGIVEWIEKNDMMNDFLNQEGNLTIQPIEQGFEAEVVKICSGKDSCVLKVWNKSSKPDISFQYQLLNVLFKRGLAVSEPLGWGRNPNGDQLLLTTFDGLPIHVVNENKMIEIANVLSKIHQIQVAEIRNIRIPKYDFSGYFFPGVSEYADINEALTSLVQLTQIKQEHIIHGDFHLRNILEKNGRYTVIDWTNGQLGDPRYDLAWSLTLLKIYVSDHAANAFRSAYLLDNGIPQKELEVFEALACLRWILLNRSDGVPKGPNIIEKVKGLLTNNPFIKEFEFTI